MTRLSVSPGLGRMLGEHYPHSRRQKRRTLRLFYRNVNKGRNAMDALTCTQLTLIGDEAGKKWDWRKAAQNTSDNNTVYQ